MISQKNDKKMKKKCRIFYVAESFSQERDKKDDPLTIILVDAGKNPNSNVFSELSRSYTELIETDKIWRHEDEVGRNDHRYVLLLKKESRDQI